MNPKIKICGIQNLSDALWCEFLKIEAIGLVFYPPSPRWVNIKTAQQIVNNLPPFITVVGLFANQQPSEIRQILATVNLDCLQFHGEETNEFCQQFNKKWIKAMGVQANTDLTQAIVKFPNARAILLDSFDEKNIGGTGKTFAWQEIPVLIKQPIILAGGLTHNNIQTAIANVKPWAVDVSSGVESAIGVKSQPLIQQLVTKVRG